MYIKKIKLVMKYLHTMVRITNIDDSLDFYCNKLGLVETRRKEVAAGRFTLVFLAGGKDINNARTIGSPELELTYNWDTEAYQGGRNFARIRSY